MGFTSILIADDDADYRFLIKMAMRDIGFTGKLHLVNDGLELMDFLNRRGRYSSSEIPDLIILDLNMPQKNGREALREIKADRRFSGIPIAILSVSDSIEDLQLSHEFSCPYLEKPHTYKGWVEAMEIALTIEPPDVDSHQKSRSSLICPTLFPPDPDPYKVTRMAKVKRACTKKKTRLE